MEPPRITLAAVNISTIYFVARQHVHFPGSSATFLLLTAASTETTIRMDRIVAVTWQQWLRECVVRVLSISVPPNVLLADPFGFTFRIKNVYLTTDFR